MTEAYIKNLLKALKFTPKNGENNVYIKIYPQHDYSIEVDFNAKKMIYGDKINLWDNTTANFSHSENLVVLECVNRLLEQGYKPQSIELEKNYLLGHKNKGKVDILVNDMDNTPFLMIECKTWGQEYDREKSKMLKDGGQLFSYYANERATKYLCLYASTLNKSQVQSVSSIIPTIGEWRVLSGTKEIVEHWNKNFKDNGIFENGVKPYFVEHKAITYDKLLDIKQEDSGKIFNQIMEILRHNVVSDKPNAFNKLLNLFVCKIIDEDKQGNSKLEFQWLESDSDESLQMRLNDLYSLGMHRFLNITVTDYKEKVIDEKLAGFNDEATKKEIKDMLIKMRLQKNPEFAFVEVCDEKTFKANAKIVKEIVELLQVYKFRYNQKHQFLGDFFELLLNTSMKQEAGQFFTPVPITKFIISSLPVKEFVDEKIEKGKTDVLPTTIDFACGSGHFLTEYMEQVQNIIEGLDVSKANRRVRELKEISERVKFDWAKDYVYGIDLDYRLIKTAKVSAFFNGDGEANIVWANGLANFKKTPEYSGALNHISELNNNDNGQFDIVISNPPYSVEAFKKQINEHGKETFELYNSLTDSSKEIECIFVERTKQLLKEGGKAGIILPSSILSNGGIHSKAREVLFKYFKFKAIAEMGNNTFMKTGTNTVILFLERRANGDWQRIKTQIDTFFKDYRDVAVDGIENAFSKYAVEVYRMDFADYKSLVKGKLNEGIKESDLVRDYAKYELKDIILQEQEKMLYFLLTYSQKIALIKSGEKQIERKFLGYEFSERRGHEGIKFYPSGTKLYDDNDKLNPQKANSYIYHAFLGNVDLDVDKDLTEHLSYAKMSELIDYNINGWDKKVNLRKSNLSNLNSRYPLKTLGEICEVKIGGTPSRNIPAYFNGNHKWVSVSELNGKMIVDTKEKITDEAIKNSNVKLIPKGTTLLSFKLSIGKVAFTGVELYTNEAIAALIPFDKNIVVDSYLFHLFSAKLINLNDIKGDNAFGKSLNSDLLKNFVKIPIPPVDVQVKIVDEFEKLAEKIESVKMSIANLQEGTKNKFDKMFGNPFENPMGWEVCKLGDVAEVIDPQPSHRTPPESSEGVPYIGIADCNYETRKFEIERARIVSRNVLDEHRDRYSIEIGDFIIGKIGTIGKPFLLPTPQDYTLSANTVLIKPNKARILPVFLFELFHSNFVESQLTLESKGNSQPALGIKKVRDISIISPPIELQNQFVDFFHQSNEAKITLIEQLATLNKNYKTVLAKHL